MTWISDKYNAVLGKGMSGGIPEEWKEPVVSKFDERKREEEKSYARSKESEDLEVSEKSKEPIDLSQYATKAQVANAINSIAKGLAERMVTREVVTVAVDKILQEVNADFITRKEAEKISEDAVPAVLRDLDDNAAEGMGNMLLLQPGGEGGKDKAYWGTVVAGLSAKGDKVLYKGIFLREYDEDGTIVTVGSETTPLPEGHTLKGTWDVTRWI